KAPCEKIQEIKAWPADESGLCERDHRAANLHAHRIKLAGQARVFADEVAQLMADDGDNFFLRKLAQQRMRKKKRLPRRDAGVVLHGQFSDIEVELHADDDAVGRTGLQAL